MAKRKSVELKNAEDKAAARKVAAIIPAKDEAERIEATIRAAARISHVDLVVVVDDGSRDATREVAQRAGAKVVRHTRNKGKAAAMQTGAAAVHTYETKYEAGREDGDTQRALLFLDADLGESAGECAPLVEPIFAGTADFTIAYLPPQEGAGGFGFVTSLGAKAIRELTGWQCQQPLSGQRCLTREAYNAALPFAAGWGVEVGMTIDLLVQGFTVQEVPCQLKHRATKNDIRGYLHRADQYKDVWRAAFVRRRSGVTVPHEERARTANGVPFSGALGKPFNAWSAI